MGQRKGTDDMLEELIKRIGEPIGLAILLIIGVIYIIREIRPMLAPKNGKSLVTAAGLACQAKDHLSAYADDQAEITAGMVRALDRISATQERVAVELGQHAARMAEFYRKAEDQWEKVAARHAALAQEHALAKEALQRIESHIDRRGSGV